jgi:hypothetical protein
MSGWENLPEEEPAATPAARKPRAAAEPTVAPGEPGTFVEESETARLIDQYTPQLFACMLIALCLIGIWGGIGKLPNHPTWWP